MTREHGVRNFQGKVVVVTGAAGGLGRALCVRFAAAGSKIVALDRDAKALADLLDYLHAQGATAVADVCDVSLEQDCRRAIAGAIREFGGIDVLANNAGITHRSAFAHTRSDVIRRVMAVNFFGALDCTYAALSSLIDRRGMIIVISSVAGFAPLIARTGYAASKHALHGFFDSLRTEVEPLGVKVMVACPSFIQTGIDKNALAGDGNLASHPQSIVGTRATPDVIAGKIFAAATRSRRRLLPDIVSRSSWWLSRLAPRIYEWQMSRKLGQEMSAGR